MIRLDLDFYKNVLRFYILQNICSWFLKLITHFSSKAVSSNISKITKTTCLNFPQILQWNLTYSVLDTVIWSIWKDGSLFSGVWREWLCGIMAGEMGCFIRTLREAKPTVLHIAYKYCLYLVSHTYYINTKTNKSTTTNQ